MLEIQTQRRMRIHVGQKKVILHVTRQVLIMESMKRVVGGTMHQHPQSSLGGLMSLATYEDCNLF
jgi:hypothetical protein